MKRNPWLLLPLLGIIAYVVLYVVATLVYPGGSQVDKHSVGFSWMNNYECNLLNEYAINGQPNAARSPALSGMFILCIALAFFWFLVPDHLPLQKNGRRTIQISGVLAMVITTFLFTKYHDEVINVACVIGTVAIVGLLAGLYKSKWHMLFWLGILNLLLGALNQYIYRSADLIVYLPVTQKISFATFLIWFAWIDVRVYWRVMLGQSPIIKQYSSGA